MSRHSAPAISGRLRGFVARYGWRAYAIPVLVALTLTVVVHSTGGGATTAAAQPAAPTSATSAPASPGSTAPAGTAADQDERFAAVAAAPVVARTDTDSDACADNQYDRLALVSIRQQRVWMCEGQRQVYTTAVTTGASTGDDQTPLGSWRVQARQRDRYLVGPGYKEYVHYWVPFDGDFGFHDAPWQTMAFGSPDYVTQGSHGCVHLPTPAMKWYYSWAQVGSTVVTVEA